jgi:opacity protein-like surface antigen
MTVAACAMLMTTASIASADGFYAGGHLGQSDMKLYDLHDPADPSTKLKLTTDGDFKYGGALGYSTGPFRIEAELGRSNHDPKSVKGGIGPDIELTGGEVNVNSLMLNGYYSFKLRGKKWRPFVTGGIGVAEVEMKNVTDGVDTINESDSGIAYQAGGGVEWQVARGVIADAKYRYMQVDDLKIDGFKSKAEGHEVGLGVRYSF